MFSSEIEFGEDWYPEENDGTHAFRWMKKKSHFLVQNLQIPGKKYLLITAACHPHAQSQRMILELYINDQKKGERRIHESFSSYAFPFYEIGNLRFDLKLNATYQVPDDVRELGIMLRRLEFKEASKSDVFLEGWYDWEYDDMFPFRWMKNEGKINISGKEAKKKRYISLYIFSEFSDLSQKLSVSFDNEKIIEYALIPKWNFYSFPLNTQSSTPFSELTISLNKVTPQKYHEGDTRELGIKASQPQFHDDEEIHRNFLFFQKNALLNAREMSEGKTVLESFPLSLGVDIYGKCNINPPCVYCLWDRMKELEGEYVEVNVDEKTLKGYHPFFQSARLIINCSFGEPLLHPRFGEIVEFCKQQKKILEISTNGQSFTNRTIQALLGKPVYLYVSLDASCKETYAKIRNDRWETIIPNLIRLNEERKKKGNLPKIYMVFMPMKVNRGDLEGYFRLGKKIEADSLVLRPLNYLENPQIEKERGGYHFDYEKELLSSPELKEIFQKCDEYSKKYGVPVANQFTFGETDKLGTKETSSHSPEWQRF